MKIFKTWKTEVARIPSALMHHIKRLYPNTVTNIISLMTDQVIHQKFKSDPTNTKGHIFSNQELDLWRHPFSIALCPGNCVLRFYDLKSLIFSILWRHNYGLLFLFFPQNEWIVTSWRHNYLISFGICPRLTHNSKIFTWWRRFYRKSIENFHKMTHNSEKFYPMTS